MSTLDINRVVASLQSSKIKERNEALALLESLTLSKFKVTSKQFRILNQGIFDLLKHEAHIYFTNKSTPVSLRLSKGSTYLRLLVSKSVNENGLKLRFRSYYELVENIIDTYYLGDSILEPCALDFNRILSTVFDQNYFKEHLNSDEWLNIYIFLVKLITRLLNESLSNLSNLANNNEKLLLESFTALQNLLQCNTSISINYLHLLSRSTYTQLLPLLTKASKILQKKETLLVIIIFKILNKLMIVLSTENIKFVNELAILGIDLMIAYYSSPWERLQNEFLVFLNLSSTHNCIDLARLTGPADTNSILDKEEEEEEEDDDEYYEEVSIRSTFGSSTKRRYSPGSKDDNEVVLYRIGILISNLMTKLHSSDFQLRDDSIRLIHTNDHARTWFQLRSIYLCSSDPKAWLLNLGLTKLITSYYKLKESTNKSSDAPFRLPSILVPTAKRQKLGLIGDSLQSSNSLFEFCNKLIKAEVDPKVQQSGLQILIFLLEGCFNDEIDALDSTSQYIENGSKQIADSSDSTFEDTTFDFQINGGSNEPFDKSIILKTILATFHNSALNYWSLLACKCLLWEYIQNGNCKGFKKINSRYFLHLLKLSLQAVKQKELSRVACNLVYSVILCQSHEELAKIIDKSIITQIDNLIDLAEINGPVSIFNEAFQFWYAIYKVVREINLPKKTILAERCQDWLLSKWENTFQPSNVNFYYDCIGLPNFISWLCGNSESIVTPKDFPGIYKGPLNEFFYFSDSYAELGNFMLLGTTSSQVTLSMNIGSLGENNNTQQLMIKILDTVRSFGSGSTNAALLQWCLLSQRILAKIKDQYVYKATTSSLEFQFATSLESLKYFNGDEDIRLFLEEFNSIVNSDVDSGTQTQFATKFSFEQLLQSLIKLRQKQATVTMKSGSVFDIDIDFSDYNGHSPTPTQQSNSLSSHYQFQYESNLTIEIIKFIFKSDEIRKRALDVTVATVANFLEGLEPEELLVAYYFLMTNYKYKINLQTVSALNLSRLVRFFGEKILVDYALERAELTLVTIARFLSLLLPVFIHEEDQNFKKDCYDMCQWFLSCGSKDLISTLAGNSSFAGFLTQLIAANDETVLNNGSLKALLFQKFSSAPNCMKVGLVPEFITLMSKSSVADQAAIYNDLFMKFPNPESCIEMCATFTLFFCSISRSSSQVMLSSLFNLLECSRFDIFIPYLKRALSSFCEYLNISNPKNLFRALKFEILICWLKFDNMELFPFYLFEYGERDTFYLENYRELVAISVATSSKATRPANTNILLSELAKLTNSDETSLVSESLPLIVPIAYTRDGIRNVVFDVVLTHLQASFKKEFKDKLILIILELIKYTDLSKEEVLIERYNTNISSLLISKNETKHLDRPGEMSVPLNSSLELMKQIIEKYSPKGEKFWMPKEIYFLFRRVSAMFQHCLSWEQKLLVLRRLKLICILGGEQILHYEVVKLIIESLTPLLNIPELVPDICNFLSALRVDQFFQYPDEQSLPIVIQTAASLLENNVQLVESHLLLAQLAQFTERLGVDRTVYHILRSFISILRLGRSGAFKGSPEIYIEAFLNDSKELAICGNGKSSKYVMKLVSLVFTADSTHKAQGNLQNVVNVLLQVTSEEYIHQTKAFNLWSARYLSKYYLQGAWTSYGKEFKSQNEYNGILSYDFEKEIKVLDTAIRGILDYIGDPDSEISACAESILGALIYKYETSRGDVLKFINFEKLYQRFKSFIFPLDFHSCVLLNDDREFDYLGDTLEYVIVNLHTIVEGSPFPIWTTRILLAIIQEISYYTTIAPLISTFVVKVTSFAKSNLAFFVCYFLSVKGKPAAKAIGALIAEFVHLKSTDEKSISLFTEIVLVLRIGARKQIPQFVEVMEGIDIDGFFEMAAKNKLYKTALMLKEDFNSSGSSKKSRGGDNSALLSRVYESIDNEDLIYGLQAETSLDFVMSMVNRGADSSEQLLYNSAVFDTEMSLHSNRRNSSILNSMVKNGLMGVSRLISKQEYGGENDDDNFEWGWKLNRWELPAPRQALKEHEVIYKTLKLVHDYPSNALNICEDSLLGLLLNKEKVVNDSLSSKEFRLNGLNWLKTLATISSIEEIFTEEKDLNDFTSTFDKITEWFENSEMKNSESILQARQIAFQLLATFPVRSVRLGTQEIWLCALNSLIRYNNLSRNAQENQKMINSMVLIDTIANTTLQNVEGIKELVQYQLAFSIWAQGQTSIPVAILKTLSPDHYSPLIDRNHHECLIGAQTVSWLAQSRQAAAPVIMEKYVEPISERAKDMQDLEQQRQVFKLLAQYCEGQFKSRGLNEEISKLERRVSDKKSEIEELKSHYGKTSVPPEEKKSVQRFYSKLKNQLQAETADLEKAKRSKDDFSERAIEYYLNSIGWKGGEELDRFFALWLELSNKEEMNSRLRISIRTLPSHLLVRWSTQLISRLSSDNSEFQENLKQMVLEMCCAHPFQALYQLISLRKHKSHAEESQDLIMISKYSAAEKIWQRLLHINIGLISEVLQPIERFCDEAIKLSEYKVSRGKSIHLEKFSIGNYWLQELPRIPPPTMDFPVDSGMYKNLPVLSSMDSKITIAASGLSLPKIATFKLSDGTEHKILLKHGTDDLRQDSIMEQVFEKVNEIFSKDKETTKRNLRIRTYKAVPLGPQSGIIEFVRDSVALIDIIKPYHVKYDKLKLEKAREMMKECQAGEKIERQRVFQKVIAKIDPVLQHFFFDTFLTPDVWFDSRIAYTRGIATTSIVGHILGLGDRHCNNILLDKCTGEPIHIDLGVAFDQGKRLPIPETVPFRLTRDIVDGFGSTGVEGVFKKSCEHTFRVLRSNKDHILSILEVLRWDPLYSWSISPIRKKKLQEEDGEVGYIKPQEDGSEAGLAVSGVSDKLIAGGLSVEATVRELIQEASSVDNLALIYFGWCPFY
ncbi:phosphatidylinositol kinase [Scheffersomyces xylosifermentans]|uniref:phosphatidylinositol kinase n=1 Tax=Scheffersomyces xylosifermentans TaxID=1304137 RepID=UPI00315D53CE